LRPLKKIRKYHDSVAQPKIRKRLMNESSKILEKITLSYWTADYTRCLWDPNLSAEQQERYHISISTDLGFLDWKSLVLSSYSIHAAIRYHFDEIFDRQLYNFGISYVHKGLIRDVRDGAHLVLLIAAGIKSFTLYDTTPECDSETEDSETEDSETEDSETEDSETEDSETEDSETEDSESEDSCVMTDDSDSDEEFIMSI